MLLAFINWPLYLLQLLKCFVMRELLEFSSLLFLMDALIDRQLRSIRAGEYPVDVPQMDRSTSNCRRWNE